MTLAHTLTSEEQKETQSHGVPSLCGVDPCYIYEPEYTDAEIRQMELERVERETRRSHVAPGATAGAVKDRMTDKWWCTCQKCEVMPTEVECYCCHEWDLIMPQMQNLSIDEEASVAASVCITNNNDFPALLNEGVLQTFLR